MGNSIQATFVDVANHILMPVGSSDVIKAIVNQGDEMIVVVIQLPSEERLQQFCKLLTTTRIGRILPKK